MSANTDERGLFNTNVYKSYLDTATLKPFQNIRIFAGIDSHTAGAGGSSYLSVAGGLYDQLRAKFGNAGYGYLVAGDAGYGQMTGTGKTWGHSGGVTQVGVIAWGGSSGNTYRSQVPFGLGCYSFSTATPISDYFFMGWRGAGATPPYDCGSVVVYANLLTASSSFTMASWWGEGAGTKVTVDNTVYPVGVPLTIVKDVPVGNVPYIMVNPSNEIQIYGVEFVPRAVSNGVSISMVGTGGTQLGQWYAFLDDTYTRNFMRILKPDLFLINAGTEDRLTYTPQQFGMMLAIVVDRLTSYGAAVLLITPHDTIDAATSYLPAYNYVRRSLANTRNLGFYDIRSIPQFATYAIANAAGLMIDGVHPNSAGNLLIANGVMTNLALF